MLLPTKATANIANRENKNTNDGQPSTLSTSYFLHKRSFIYGSNSKAIATAYDVLGRDDIRNNNSIFNSPFR